MLRPDRLRAKDRSAYAPFLTHRHSGSKREIVATLVVDPTSGHRVGAGLLQPALRVGARVAHGAREGVDSFHTEIIERDRSCSPTVRPPRGEAGEAGRSGTPAATDW